MSRHLLGVLGIAVLVARITMAGQTTVLDQTYVHDGWYKHFGTGDMTTVPNGSNQNDDCYFRFEIMEYTGNPGPFMLQPCFFWNSIAPATHACFQRNGAYTFTELETRYIKREMSTMWQYGSVNWNNIMDYMLIDNYGADNANGKGTVKPRVRAELICVSPGEQLQAPDHWIEPADWDACVDQGCPESADQVSLSRNGRSGAHAAMFSIVRAQGRIGVRLSNGGVHRVALFDMRGNRVLYRHVRGSDRLALDRATLGVSGTYLIHVWNAMAAESRTIVIQ
ncbi:MAG: hypothetical protein GF418_09700 [Chitinivibrionales bacterium]|nr:hypothetical protein [Chitinivibrionales bacterium]MBD3395884.1 hypothetical protein [Chitinivibrionales bacterium]